MNELTTRDQSQNQSRPADPAEIMLGMKRPLLTSLDIDTERGKVLYAAAMGDPDIKGSKAIDHEFMLTDFLFHTYRVEDDKTGVVEIRPRLCVFTDRDECFAMSGQICIESFVMLTGIWGLPPWNPPKHVRVIAAGRGYKMVPVREILGSKEVEPKRKGDK